MSWIRNHVRHYVVPALKAYAKRPSFTDLHDEKHKPINMRPAHGCKHKELGLILAACRCFNLPLASGQEQMLRTGSSYRILGSRGYSLQKPEDKIHNAIKNSCKAIKRILKKDSRRKLILPGRDVWLWSVQCHKMGIPHIFDPRISRLVSRDGVILKAIVDTWKIDEHTIIFDTGFAGSIYRRIVEVSGVNCINLMFSTKRKNPQTQLPEQLWPYHRSARGKALAIEYLPKYQKTGTTNNGQCLQYMADYDEFLLAAALTIWFWHYESPTWISQGEHRCRVINCSCRSCLLWKEGKHAPASKHLGN